MKQILVVTIFCKLYEEGCDYYFSIDETVERRVKQLLIDHCKERRKFVGSCMLIDVSDELIEQTISNIEFDDKNQFDQLFDELFLFMSAERDYLR